MAVKGVNAFLHRVIQNSTHIILIRAYVCWITIIYFSNTINTRRIHEIGEEVLLDVLCRVDTEPVN